MGQTHYVRGPHGLRGFWVDPAKRGRFKGIVDIDMEREERETRKRIGRLTMPTATTEKEAAQQIADSVNCMSINEDEVGKLLANQHSTLQQNFMRAVVGFLREMAAKEYTDARNEASHELAKLLLEDISDDNMFLPFV